MRIVGVVGCLGCLELRALVECCQIVFHDAEELVEVATRTVLHDQRHTRVGREARNHRWCEGQNLSVLDVGGLDIDLGQHTAGVVGVEEETVDAVALPQSGEFPPESFLSLLEGFELEDEGGLVGTGTGNEVVTLNLLTALDGRVGSQDGVYLIDDCARASHRGGGRHRDGAEHGTGVLVGHKTRLGGEHGDDEYRNASDNRDDHGHGLAHQFLYALLILAQDRVVGSVERGMETVDARHFALVSLFVVRLQEDGTQGGRERQGVQCRDEDTHGHGHTKLTIERTGGATDERHWDEHRGHHQRDGDDSSRNLVHGIDRGRQRRLVTLVELGMHSLDYHNGIVDHNGNGQEQGRQRQQVDGESEYRQEEERTNERYGNGNKRDERRAPVLQEYVDDQEHQNEGEHQGEHHLLDRGIEELGHVVVNLIVHARGEQLSLLFELGLHLLGNLVGVRTSNLLHHTHHRRDVVVLHRHRILLTAQFDLGNVFQFQSLSVGIARDDDVAKLLGSLQTSGVTDGILVGHVRLLAEGTRSGLYILFGQCAADVAGHQSVLLHHVGFQPDAHRVGLQTGALYVAHTLNTLDGRNNVDVVVVGQELIVVATVGGQREHEHLRGLTLHDRHTDARYFGREQGLCLLHTVLHVDGTHVGVHALAEQHRNGCRTRRGTR